MVRDLPLFDVNNSISRLIIGIAIYYYSARAVHYNNI
jgi:hypothetical protein